MFMQKPFNLVIILKSKFVSHHLQNFLNVFINFWPYVITKHPLNVWENLFWNKISIEKFCKTSNLNFFSRFKIKKEKKSEKTFSWRIMKQTREWERGQNCHLLIIISIIVSVVNVWYCLHWWWVWSERAITENKEKHSRRTRRRKSFFSG